MKIFILSILGISAFVSLTNGSNFGQRLMQNDDEAEKNAHTLEGPNVCIIEEIQGGSYRKLHTGCGGWYKHREICQRSTMLLQECCEGFEQVEGEKGCTAIKPLKNLVEVARDLGLESFLSIADGDGLLKTLETRGAFTVFVPSEEAFKQAKNAANIVLEYHMGNGRYKTKALKHTQEVESLISGMNLRIGKYNNGINTMNCARILNGNQEATNGVIHIIDKVLDVPVSSIVDILQNDPRLTKFKALLEQAGKLDILNSAGPFTIFAPTDLAIESDSQIELIIANEDGLAAMLDSHVLKGLICSAALIKSHHLTTLEGTRLNATCLPGERISVNGGKVIESDIIATNGVINIINNVIIPEKAKTVLALAKNIGLTTFVERLEAQSLHTTLDMENPKFTLFAPSNKAFENLPKEIQNKLAVNPSYMRELLETHLVIGKLASNSFIDGQMIPTFSAVNNLRVNVNRRRLSIENACVTDVDRVARNGFIHVVDKVIIPATKSVLEILESDINFSSLHMVIQSSGFALPTSGRMTVFAPLNEAFDLIPTDILNDLLDDPEGLKKTVGGHVVPDMLYSSCAFNRERVVYPLETMAGSTTTVRNNDGRLSFGKAKVVTADIMATDGIIHIVDKVITP
ncbi:unnamed protein product [Owenia fusiformis]|uniref:Uncharacterized protein n=1 Tax=Owenia fusiformis TaxID=6347 RepID=A0A8J1TGY7_OWEFU|nr:unnamed protein product [Owenia fusiformis]